MSKQSAIDRREFLSQIGLAGLALSSTGLLTGCDLWLENLLRQIKNRPIRRDLAAIEPDHIDIVTWKEGIEAMRDLPEGDPRNWNNIALAHQEYCPHGNWYFLPWHRGYLHSMEQVIRSLTGQPKFALPYWNWVKDPVMSSVFHEPGSVLNHPRSLAPGRSLGSFPGNPFHCNTLDRALDEFCFDEFGSRRSDQQVFHPESQGEFNEIEEGKGALEGTLHDFVHRIVGGDMANVPVAPLDPVFWAHHSFVEWCWVERSFYRALPNPAETEWLDWNFEKNFVDSNGNQVDASPRSLAVAPMLFYRYDKHEMICRNGAMSFETEKPNFDDAYLFRSLVRATAPVAGRKRPILALASHEELELHGVASLDFPKDPIVDSINNDVGRVMLRVRYARDVREDVFVRVFVNQPGATIQTDPQDNPNFVASFAFFGVRHHASANDVESQMTQTIEIGSTLRRLSQLGQIVNDKITLTFVVVEFDSAQSGQTVGTVFTLTGIDLYLSLPWDEAPGTAELPLLDARKRITGDDLFF